MSYRGMSYREWQKRLASAWLQQGTGGRFLEGLGEAKDGLAEAVRQAVLARMTQRAPEDALSLIGEERLLPRFPGEFVEAYRTRLLAAWEFWRQAGTLPGLVYWLRAAGYDAHIWELYRYNPSLWAEFAVYLWPYRPEWTTDRWDDGGTWDDETDWDYTLNGLEPIRTLELIHEVKPAHARLRFISYIPGPKDAWNDAGVWDDGGTWNPEPVYIAGSLDVWNDGEVWDDGGVWDTYPI
jgi:hypothetical protein